MTAQAPPVGVGERVRLHVRALASNGAGVADLPDGRVVFIQRTAPGDVVRARVVRLRHRWGEAVLEEVVETGPNTVPAPCVRYATCGGCTLQHLPYQAQVQWKRRFVSDALARIGGVEVAVDEGVPSPRTIRYRNRVTFTVRSLAGGRVVAGFHALAGPGRVVDVGGECLLPEEPIAACWEALRRTMAEGRRPLPAAPEVKITLRGVASGVMAVVKGGARDWDPASLLSCVPGLAGVWHQADGETRPTHVAGPAVVEEWSGEQVPVVGHAFLQVNREGAKGLVKHVLDSAGAGGRAVDAYCGVGVYGRALARLGWSVLGIEADPDACSAARHDAPEGFHVREGRVEELLGGALPAELAILNPPRTGLHESLPGVLARRPPARIVYVSCDPGTLARDTQRLEGAYQLTGARPFDLFPQTNHVETVAVFETRGSDR